MTDVVHVVYPWPSPSRLPAPCDAASPARAACLSTYTGNLKIRTSTDDSILNIFYCDLSQVKLATEWLCMALLCSTGTNSGIHACAPFFCS